MVAMVVRIVVAADFDRCSWGSLGDVNARGDGRKYRGRAQKMPGQRRADSAKNGVMLGREGVVN